MYNGCNKTALSSQNTIAEGFYRLLKEKDYSKISVSEICKEAGGIQADLLFFILLQGEYRSLSPL